MVGDGLCRCGSLRFRLVSMWLLLRVRVRRLRDDRRRCLWFVMYCFRVVVAWVPWLRFMFRVIGVIF